MTEQHPPDAQEPDTDQGTSSTRAGDPGFDWKAALLWSFKAVAIVIGVLAALFVLGLLLLFGTCALGGR